MITDTRLLCGPSPRPDGTRPLSTRTRAVRGAVLAAALVLSGQVFAQEARSGTIKAVIGDVVVVRGTDRQPAASGGALVERDRIVTGATSGAAVSLRDGTAIVVGPNSTVDLSSFQYDATKQQGSMAIGLINGSLRFITGLVGKNNPERVKISTRTATLGIRGTDFILEAP